MRLDHLQLAMPAHEEAKARRFFADILGFIEEEKPYPLSERGGCWFRKDSVILHIGVDSPFSPQSKAHPAFLVPDIDSLAAKLEASGHPVKRDHALPNRKRFYTADPFGNRIGFLQDGHGFSQA